MYYSKFKVKGHWLSTCRHNRRSSATNGRERGGGRRKIWEQRELESSKGFLGMSLLEIY